jgi:hypothetical protein
MEKGRIEKLLKALPGRSIEGARPGLAQEVKSRIPERLSTHRMDTINIIVDLRISRVAAAAVILLTILLIGGLFGGRDIAGKRMYQDSKLLLKYTLGGEKACQTEIIAGLQRFRDDLAAQGREVVYYGTRVNLKDPYAIVMHWTIEDDKYGVVFSDLTTRTVTAKTLIRLQARMVEDSQK